MWKLQIKYKITSKLQVVFYADGIFQVCSLLNSSDNY